MGPPDGAASGADAGFDPVEAHEAPGPGEAWRGLGMHGVTYSVTWDRVPQGQVLRSSIPTFLSPTCGSRSSEGVA